LTRAQRESSAPWEGEAINMENSKKVINPGIMDRMCFFKVFSLKTFYVLRLWGNNIFLFGPKNAIWPI
jgi:hypothetical protein